MEHHLGTGWITNPPYSGVERRKRKPLFGMRLRSFDVAQTAAHILTSPRTAAQGVGLFVTPNIQHVALARTDPEFASAMQSAQIVVCDGFPVYRYAQFRGQALPGRITGREIVQHMLDMPESLIGHRIFLVVDSIETAAMIGAWMATNAPSVAVEMIVPPFGFDQDNAYCVDLAARIAHFQTSLLFLCIGAPRSEVFVHRHRSLLPPCWALCVGQSFKVALGMTAAPPTLMVRLNLEWLWRIVLEPRRMMGRYGPASLGFAASVWTDLRSRPPRA